MSYQGLVLALTVGVAVGTFLYNFFKQTENRYSYDEDCFDNYNFAPRTASNTQPRRRKRDDNNCTICLCKLENGKKTLPCSHVFHAHCINSWFTTSFRKSCPICRQDVV